MSALSAFFKNNKKVKPNAFYPATKSLTDVDGKALEWEIKAISTKDNEAIREECMVEVPVKGKPHQVQFKLNSRAYLAKLIVKTVVFPDLYDKDLQDSYGVRTPEELVMELVDNPREYNELVGFIQDHSGLNETKADKVAKAKN